MSLSNKDLKRFKSLLINQKTSLLKAGETGRQAEQVVDLDQTRVGRLSRMDALQTQAMSIETGRRRRLKLAAITAALDRLSTGAYGKCFECGEPVNPGRLAADPSAELCIKCAELAE